MNRAATIALLPLSAAYGLGVRIRNSLYRRGLRKILDVGAPVISVGNLTTGGTGKTPLVELLASRMAGSGWRVCVLTRGYGRKSTGRVVVADNDSVLADLDEAGDEPLLLAENLRGRAAVVCDKNRVAAARWAIANLGSQIFILDDAFQHQQIRRTVNILVVDATNTFGNGKLLPAGNLREPVTELKRADCIVITRASESEDLEQLRARIGELAGPIPIFTSNTKLAEGRSLDRTRSSEDVPDRKVAMASFCGIGNPNSFVTLLRREGYNVVHSREFRDHHSYSQSDINQLVNDAFARGAHALITTTKDAVKLRSLTFDLPCYVVDASMQIEQPEAFFRFIDQRSNAN
ncbi:MAG TPA: tetraacyldisaccharide 4'-kinase [Pyrinomonadaceae bacterium]|nr:tetraacyldisaccharide 4'-kinase [Pyrinomonadaceae bacterium]